MDDYIPRSAALDALCKTCPLKGAECLETEECAPFKHIQAIPAADVRPVKPGRWIHPVPGDGEPHCSECKAEAPLSGGMFPYHRYTNFCPECGADMREPKPKGLECECDTCRIPETGTCRYGEEG